MVDEPLQLSPANVEFVVICFEGPDLYSQAGGLGVRVSELTWALAEQGFSTHLIFVGDPTKASIEQRHDGRLTLYRWSQWVSRYYPAGVYEGENEKLYDFNESVPGHVVDQIVNPALKAGRTPIVLGEDWHTAHTLCRISDLLFEDGRRDRVLLTWNANNPMGFDKINWGRLDYIATITTVSRYMKHVMWRCGVNPIVVPNGIPERLLGPPPAEEAGRLRAAVDTPLFLFKVGRWDPDKRWNMAVEAVAQLKALGRSPKFFIRGGVEAHEKEVLATAKHLGLRTVDIRVDDATLSAVIQGIGGVEADIYNLKLFCPPELLRAFYHAADAVLANSGMEPFGLVGLEVMAASGVAFTGATGEDYARAFENAMVLETDNPSEIVSYLAHLGRRPEEIARIRQEARITSRRYAWPLIIGQLLSRLEFVGASSGLRSASGATALEGTR